MNSSSSSEDEGDIHQLTVNEHYAKAFQYRKEREELVKRTHCLLSCCTSLIFDPVMRSQGEVRLRR
jgi:hypothetical protein